MDILDKLIIVSRKGLMGYDGPDPMPTFADAVSEIKGLNARIEALEREKEQWLKDMVEYRDFRRKYEAQVAAADALAERARFWAAHPTVEAARDLILETQEYDAAKKGGA